jgi:hypothetical protein
MSMSKDIYWLFGIPINTIILLMVEINQHQENVEGKGIEVITFEGIKGEIKVGDLLTSLSSKDIDENLLDNISAVNIAGISSNELSILIALMEKGYSKLVLDKVNWDNFDFNNIKYESAYVLYLLIVKGHGQVALDKANLSQCDFRSFDRSLGLLYWRKFW